MSNEESVPRAVDRSRLPGNYPAHLLSDEFLAALGRTVATFGFLEETLVRATYSLTGTVPAPNENVEHALRSWLGKLERALKDSLGGLITVYGSAYRAHPRAASVGFEDLVRDLRSAADIRNVLCHGSWPPPNAQGAAVPFFVNRDLLVFDTPVDAAFLNQTQKHVSELICDVIDSVTQLGLVFPGEGESAES